MIPCALVTCMSLVGWAIVLGLPVYALVQWWLIVRLGEEVSVEDGAGLPLSATYGGTVPHLTGEPAGTGSVTCRSCGAENAGSFDYCGRCVAPLDPAESGR